MSRSLKKGLFVDERLINKIKGRNPHEVGAVKTWSRSCTIIPDMVGWTFLVHNGKDFINVLVNEEKVGHKLGEFSLTRKFYRHGGKIQKELDQAARQRDIDVSKTNKK